MNTKGRIRNFLVDAIALVALLTVIAFTLVVVDTATDAAHDIASYNQ